VPELRVRRDELSVCEMVEGERLRALSGEGEAQLLVERFSLSAAAGYVVSLDPAQIDVPTLL